jgi:hypothetical protein
MKKEDKNLTITNRNNWLFVLVSSMFAIIVAYKLAITPLQIDLSAFTFTDLLSLAVALFAVAMSVAFYFKATDTSNQFYDNTYRFTKEVSEILGRIEAGFGERLKHLDEGYAGIREKVERMPFDPVKVQQAMKKEEEEVKKHEEERNQLIENLAKRAKLKENEKHHLFQRLKEQEKELVKARNELEFLQQRLDRSERDVLATLDSYPPHVVDYITKNVVPELGGKSRLMRLLPASVKRRFISISEQFHPKFLEDAKELSIINAKGELTTTGEELFRHIALRHDDS